MPLPYPRPPPVARDAPAALQRCTEKGPAARRPPTVSPCAFCWGKGGAGPRGVSSSHPSNPPSAGGRAGGLSSPPPPCVVGSPCTHIWEGGGGGGGRAPQCRRGGARRPTPSPWPASPPGPPQPKREGLRPCLPRLWGGAPPAPARASAVPAGGLAGDGLRGPPADTTARLPAAAAQERGRALGTEPPLSRCSPLGAAAFAPPRGLPRPPVHDAAGGRRALVRENQAKRV